MDLENKTVLGEPEILENHIKQEMNSVCDEVLIVDSQSVNSYRLSEFQKEKISIGRKEDNDIVLALPFVSGTHAYIERRENRLSVVDCDSTNGLFLCQGGKFKQLDGGQPLAVTHANTILRIGKNEQQYAFLIFTKHNSAARWNTYQITKNEILIGREQTSDIVISDVSASRSHARIVRSGNKAELIDLNSTNGVVVNNTIVRGRAKLSNMDIIHIANCVLIYTPNLIIYTMQVEGVSLQLKGLNKVVSRKKTILDKVSMTIEPNEFVAIIGGSGAGKSTLMTAMSGFDHAITGELYFNHLDLRAGFDAVKNMIGFVPQQDIIYENLTLRKMLLYAAKMKMSSDVRKQEIEQRIKEVLDMVELSDHQNTLIRKLSGGQKKRASIAVELLSDPRLFFLDEPTSGLDPGTERNLMYTLKKLATEQKKTILMVTHTTQNIHLCDKIVIMGRGGKLCYYGAPDKALEFFGVESLVEVYDMTTQNSEYWETRFKETQTGEKAVVGNDIDANQAKKKKYSKGKQLCVLIARYFELIKNDVSRLILLFLQPLLIGLLLMLVASEDVFKIFEDTRSILFSLTCSGIWIGLFNTIQEICKERHILKREYMSNLSLGNYILSKCIVQGVLCMLQAFVLLLCFTITVGSPEAGILMKEPFAEMYITLFLTIYSSSALGLIVSALSKNGDRAMAVAPFILIIQLLFSGILFELEGATDLISKFTVSRWSMEALGSVANLNSLTSKIQVEFPMFETEINDMFKATDEHMFMTWGLLLVCVVICSVISGLVLRNLSKEQR